VARYRLRFLLQEFDLPPGPTYIGRSSECQVTIEDPLVSRRHACIDVGEMQVTVADAGSRNGVRVNGQLIRGTLVLANNDRIRIGTMEMVFTAMHEQLLLAKTTGFLRHCARCRLPYPEESGACPNCGTVDWLPDDTVTGVQGDQQSWQLQLYIEVIGRALSASRFEDAERNLRRASGEIDARCSQSVAVEPRHWSALLESTTRFALLTHSAMWACWIVRLHRQLERAPDLASMTCFRLLRSMFPVEMSEVLREIAVYFGARLEPSGTSNPESWLAFFDEVPTPNETDVAAFCARGAGPAPAPAADTAQAAWAPPGQADAAHRTMREAVLEPLQALSQVRSSKADEKSDGRTRK
jgi:FHA domain